MNAPVKNTIIVIAGLLIGGMVNGGIIGIGPMIIPNPEGLPDPAMASTMKEQMQIMNDSMSMLKPIHFLMPFLAHALGTLVAALIVGKFAASHQKKLCLLVGAFFFIGGFYMTLMLPDAPKWFSAVDLVLAYLPMGYLGWILTGRRS